ncbi:hypothetical protein BDP27DRAFT_1065921 [Rhodocollybia butyracea]|uniref:Secreted protein n=1 Tax=Rhodocollybia butyracea TaxID=206335 RepID=A0A9P5P4W3_9AGAR|nr:hypothetical protein BDP27DRAFT_1065921 [Rhodocollybia butyracea]
MQNMLYISTFWVLQETLAGAMAAGKHIHMHVEYICGNACYLATGYGGLPRSCRKIETPKTIHYAAKIWQPHNQLSNLPNLKPEDLCCNDSVTGSKRSGCAGLP